VAKFANEFAPNAAKLMLRVEDLTLASIRQYCYHCKSDAERLQFLGDIYGYLTLGQTVIFVNVRIRP
jgi:ATP-dependent RNA helicase DDX19/DBP5